MNQHERILFALSRIGGIRQKDLAKELDISPGALTQMKTGEIKTPKAKVIATLAQLSGVRLEWLIDGRGSPLPTEPDIDALVAFIESLGDATVNKVIDRLSNK